MQVMIISGFTEPGKGRLIREIVESANGSRVERRLDLLLFELFEDDLSLSSYDELFIREMGGGCPCCTMEGELRKVLISRNGAEERLLVIETGGGCDLQRMKTIFNEVCPSCDIASVVVMESTTMKVVLEVVPVMGENVANADLLVVMDADNAGVTEALRVLKDVLPNRIVDIGKFVGGDERLMMVPISSKGDSLIDEYLSGLVQ